ncbi:hypothetical protein RB195_024672 [Necator americanus]|uniref:Reverse transcriptase domain-containing protein n=1 Tax=Necator americanus TaxID=51031 RepID=A0ABR1EP80_NECAM
MGREQHSGARGKWYYPKEHTSDNANRLVDLCEQAGLIVAFAFKRAKAFEKEWGDKNTRKAYALLKQHSGDDEEKMKRCSPVLNTVNGVAVDRLVRHRGETTCDEQAGFRPGQSTIDQVFIVRQ